MAAAACSSNPTEVLLWQDIAPRLDDAVLALSSDDRQAILLRFFEGKSNRDLAVALGISEDAAKQRLSRAVARLRQRLCPAVEHPGIPAAAFTAILTTFAVQSAPASLATTALSTATTAAVTTGTGFTIAKGALAMMTWTKTKIAAAILAVATLAGTGGVIALNPAIAQDRASKSEKPAPDAMPALPTPGGPVDTAPPVVVKTIPESGSVGVDPKLTEIKVTFSKPMQDGNWSFVQTAKETFPKTVGKPRFLPDQRTCILTVQLEPNKGYVIWINRAPYNSFSDPEGRKAVPYLLTFETGR